MRTHLIDGIKVASCRKKIKFKYFKVASTGIEPVSGASETLILSIVLRGRFMCDILRLMYDNYFPNWAMLLLNILTAIASKITPKNFLTTINPFGPSALSIHFKDFNTTKITTQLMRIPIKIFTS